MGEVLLTSVDRDGTKKGLDIQLVRSAGKHLRIPLIASGGIGTPQDCADAILEGGADAVAIATTLHYGVCELDHIRACCDAHNIKTRRIQPANWSRESKRRSILASSVTVIDYGIVNLANIVRALEFVGAKVQISDCPNEISRASRIVLPGVGAFGAGMNKLKEKRLDEALKSTSNDRPLMGICLGMQMLLDMSTEFGEHTGLGIIAGTVTSLDSHAVDIEKQRLKIPNVGWRELHAANCDHQWKNSCLKNVECHDSVYFVHSYMGGAHALGQYTCHVQVRGHQA